MPFGQTNYELAASLLQVAVPLNILQLKALPLERFWATWREWVELGEASVVFSEAMLFKTKPGDSARAFNGLAKALAALAFVPGGVTLFGSHWEEQVPVAAIVQPDHPENIAFARVELPLSNSRRRWQMTRLDPLPIIADRSNHAEPLGTNGVPALILTETEQGGIFIVTQPDGSPLPKPYDSPAAEFVAIGKAEAALRETVAITAAGQAILGREAITAMLVETLDGFTVDPSLDAPLVGRWGRALVAALYRGRGTPLDRADIAVATSTAVAADLDAPLVIAGTHTTVQSSRFHFLQIWHDHGRARCMAHTVEEVRRAISGEDEDGEGTALLAA